MSQSARRHVGSHLAPSTVWDVPNPPGYDHLSMYEPLLDGQIIRCKHFSTIPLSGCSGITFFMRFGRIVGFHCHTQRETCAQTSFERLRLPEPEKYHWHYLPISEEDEIVSVGMSSPQSGSEEEYNGIIVSFILKMNPLLQKIHSGCDSIRERLTGRDFSFDLSSQATLSSAVGQNAYGKTIIGYPSSARKLYSTT